MYQLHLNYRIVQNMHTSFMYEATDWWSFWHGFNVALIWHVTKLKGQNIKCYKTQVGNRKAQ